MFGADNNAGKFEHPACLICGRAAAGRHWPDGGGLMIAPGQPNNF
jgi:hypothetical protein